MAQTTLKCLRFGLAAVAAIGATVATAGSTMPAAVVALNAALGGVAGNYLTDLCKLLHQPAARRFLEGRSGIDENGHVASALRLAHLKALREVQHRFDTTRATDHDPDRRRPADRFSTKLANFITAETKTAQNADFHNPTNLAEDERRLRDDVLNTLPATFDQGLAARRATGDTTAIVRTLAEIRATVEAAVLAEIRLRTATLDEPLPPAFQWAFDGTGYPDSWFDLFIRDAAEKITAIPAFGDIWKTEQLSLIRAITDAHTAALKEIAEGVRRIEGGVTDIRATQIEQAAVAEKQAASIEKLTQALVDALGDNKDLSKRLEAANVDKAKVMAIARRSAENLQDFDQALRELENHAAVAIEVSRDGGGGHNLGAFVEAVLGRIRARYEAADFDAAAAAATQGFEAWRKREAERREEAAQAGLTILQAGLQQDILRRDPAAAAERIELMAGIESSGDATTLLQGLRAQYDTWYERGRDQGLMFDLEVAIALARRALAHTRTGDQRGFWENLLGIALQTLGQRESGTARLQEAVAAYRAAQEEYTRDRVPLDWAMTQNNLGVALATLGERESGTARLQEAVAAYHAALEELTRDRVPLDWAATQNNLGSALLTLGERESGTARLEQAVAAYRAALGEHTRDRVPLDWAMTQNNLGNALATLGARETGTARLEEAVAAYRAALEERTRDRVPLDWAMTQNNLGAALWTLGERESGTARLQEAVAAYRAALEEYTRDRVPLDWAMTQNNLGTALQTLGARESGTARLQEAVAAYRAALEEYTRDRVPLNWATTQNNLGNALQTLGERESGTARLEQAVAAYRAALEERTRDRVPLDWATSFGSQGVALMHLADRTNDPALATTALDQITTAFTVLHDGGHATFAAYLEQQLPNAHAVVARLSHA